MPSNKIKLEICGSPYVITATDDEGYVLALAEKLDEDMSKILEESPSATMTAAAVITALGYLDDMQKIDKSADNMREQIKNYLEDASKAKQDAVRAKQEIERLQKEIERLRGYREN